MLATLPAAPMLATSMPAAAQMIDMPIWSNGILGQQALRNTYDNYNRANGLDPDDGRRDRRDRRDRRECSADALPAAERREMEREYMHRARSDGKASADAWVHEQGRRFHERLVAEGVCPAPARSNRNLADNNRPRASKKQVLDRDGKPCNRTRVEVRPVADLGGGGMTMGMVPVCDN